jgi:hypothetical protein
MGVRVVDRNQMESHCPANRVSGSTKANFRQNTANLGSISYHMQINFYISLPSLCPQSQLCQPCSHLGPKVRVRKCTHPRSMVLTLQAAWPPGPASPPAAPVSSLRPISCYTKNKHPNLKLRRYAQYIAAGAIVLQNQRMPLPERWPVRDSEESDPEPCRVLHHQALHLLRNKRSRFIQNCVLWLRFR